MKTILSSALISLAICSPAIASDSVKDHFKVVLEQKPYQVEVCRDVTTSGDKTGDALKGAILGGILGNNLKGEENGGAIGAVIGGMLGHANSNATGSTKTVCSTETRYNETQRTVYSHSTITFRYEGKNYTLKFVK